MSMTIGRVNMATDLSNLIKKSLYVFVFIGLICFLIKKYVFEIASVTDYLDIVELAVTVTLAVMVFYGSFLWKFNPLEKTPRIMGKYQGNIKYCYNNIPGVKETEVEIRQTLFGVKVKIKTNEITSDTITGNFVKENDEYVLYYNYITNPKSKYSEKNPIQRGTARLVSTKSTKKHANEWAVELSGIYWTSRKTIGDMYLVKVCE